jgi:hypothetical protein
MIVPDRIKVQAELNIRRVGPVAKYLLPKRTNVHYIIALANGMLQQAPTVYEPDWRSDGSDQQPQDE